MRRKPPTTRADAEQQASDAVPQLRRGPPPSGSLTPGAVPGELRGPVEEWGGVDLSHVRMDPTRDPAAGDAAGSTFSGATSSAATVHAGLAAPLAGTELGRDIVLHELVHAAQARSAELSGQAGGVQGLRLRFCGGGGSSTAIAKLRTGERISSGDASSLLDHYESLDATRRDAFVTEFHTAGLADTGVRRLMAALDPTEMKSRAALVVDLTERVQRLAVEKAAGKTTAQLGAEQGAFMKKEAEAKALADAAAEAAKKGKPPPKVVAPADVAKAHEEATKKTSPIKVTVTNAWDALDPTVQAKWNARAAVVILNVARACTKQAPELGITTANLKFAPREVAAAGSNVYAFSGNPISFGMGFVEAAEADPEYAIRTVVHEIAGHPEFGDRFKSTEAMIYAEAHKAEPSLGSPWDTEEEENTFGYIGTEIYAALREYPHEKPITAADKSKGILGAIEPEANIDNKLGLVKVKYAPGVGEAIVQGLYERFRIDPRVSPKALQLFEKLVHKHFPGKLVK